MAFLRARLPRCARLSPISRESQAFSRVYTDPSNAEIAQLERRPSMARFVEQATSQSGDNMEKHLLVTQRDNALRPEGQGR